MRYAIAALGTPVSMCGIAIGQPALSQVFEAADVHVSPCWSDARLGLSSRRRLPRLALHKFHVPPLFRHVHVNDALRRPHPVILSFPGSLRYLPSTTSIRHSTREKLIRHSSPALGLRICCAPETNSTGSRSLPTSACLCGADRSACPRS